MVNALRCFAWFIRVVAPQATKGPHGKNCFFESNKFNLRKSIYLGQIKNLLNVNKV